MFKIKDLMINLAPAAPQANAGQAQFCGFGITCGGWSCIHFTCPALTCINLTCYNYSCHIGRSIFTLPEFQAAAAPGPAPVPGPPVQAQLFCPPHSIVPCLEFTNPCIHQPFTICPAHSCAFFSCGVCSVAVSYCPNFSCQPTVVGPQLGNIPDPAAAAQQLAALKAELQQALRDVETQQQAADESLRPQTVAEVEQLQAKLKDALAELDSRKQELQKQDKSTKPGK